MFRNAILDAAEEVFGSSGFHGARVQEIARRARLAVGTIYNHFEQKEDILLALLELRMREMVALLAPLPEEPADFAHKLTARIERLLAYRARHIPFFVVAVEHGLLGEATGAARHLLGDRPLPHAGRFEKALLELVDDGIASGALESKDRQLLAMFLKYTIRAGGRWSFEHGPVADAELARTVVALFLGGAERRGALRGGASATRKRPRTSARSRA